MPAFSLTALTAPLSTASNRQVQEESSGKKFERIYLTSVPC